MPLPFILPTTSYISFPDYFTSTTHPSLPLAATSRRGVLRVALKKHKRLPPSARSSHLSTILSVLHDYIPYLLALDAGLSSSKIAGEELDVVLVKELDVEWRCTLTSSGVAGREAPRIKLKSLEAEIFFALQTLAHTHSLVARSHLHTLLSTGSTTASTGFESTLSADQRTAAIAAAMRSFLAANSIHNYLLARSQHWTSPAGAVDISPPVLSALAELTLAEATLITVLKDDPYPGIVAEDRNKASKEWMVKSPEIPKVRAHLFARLCLAAAEHAAKGQGMLGRTARVDEGLVKYLDDLRRTARGKACRFLGIDAELAGEMGKGIAWLRGAKKELGFTAAGADEEGEVGGLRKLKREWAERREDKKIERGGEWGSDAGRLEEGRVVEMLERKWVRINDNIGVQLVPPSEQLITTMPSGREYHTSAPFIAPMLDEDVLIQMRAPPDPSELALKGDEDDSGDDDGKTPVGAFPGTKGECSAGTAYY